MLVAVAAHMLRVNARCPLRDCPHLETFLVASSSPESFVYRLCRAWRSAEVNLFSLKPCVAIAVENAVNLGEILLSFFPQRMKLGQTFLAIAPAPPTLILLQEYCDTNHGIHGSRAVVQVGGEYLIKSSQDHFLVRSTCRPAPIRGTHGPVRRARA